MSGPIKRIFGGLIAIPVILILLALPPLLVVIGWWQIVVQDHRIDTYLPAPAVIQRSGVVASESDSGSTYEPEAIYRYSVGTREYWGVQVTPIPLDQSGGAATQIISSLGAGQATRAWYDRQHPEQSFLVRRYVDAPVIFVQLGMLFVVIFTLAPAATIGRGIFRRRLGTPSKAPSPADQWRLHWPLEVVPIGYLRFFWYIVGGVAALDFVARARLQTPMIVWVTTTIYVLLGMFPWRMKREIVDAAGSPCTALRRTG